MNYLLIEEQLHSPYGPDEPEEFFIEGKTKSELFKKAKNLILSKHAWDDNYNRYFEQNEDELGLVSSIDLPFEEYMTFKYDILTKLTDVYAYFGKKKLMEA